MNSKGAFLLCLVSFFAGCADFSPKIQTAVSSFAANGAEMKKHYFILSGDPSTTPDDLQFSEYSRYVDAALADRGFVKESSIEKADVCIVLLYSISDPKTYQSTYSIPTFGQTGVLSSSTYGTISSSGSFSGTTTYIPTYGITGYQTGVKTNTVFTRAILLDALDLGDHTDKNMPELWKTSAVSTGSSGDLRYVFPYLVAAIKPYIATNTGKAISIMLPFPDPTIEALRKSGQATQTLAK